MAARVRLPYFSSLPSKRSNSVNASAVPPAKPASTLPLDSRRTLRALLFMTVLPSVTCPSPPSAMAPRRRTARIVVAWGSNGCCIGLSSTAALGARVSALICAGQMLEIKMGVDLRRTDVGVAQQLLHAPQISAGFKQMGGKGVPEQVRVDPLPEPLCP